MVDRIADQFSERLTDWVPVAAGDVAASYRCVRCRDGEKPCVRGNLDMCEWRAAAVGRWRRAAPVLLHADRLCTALSVTLPRQRLRRWSWAQIAEFALTGVGVLGAAFVAGFGLGVPS